MWTLFSQNPSHPCDANLASQIVFLFLWGQVGTAVYIHGQWIAFPTDHNKCFCFVLFFSPEELGTRSLFAEDQARAHRIPTWNTSPLHVTTQLDSHITPQYWRLKDPFSLSPSRLCAPFSVSYRYILAPSLVRMR